MAAHDVRNIAVFAKDHLGRPGRLNLGLTIFGFEAKGYWGKDVF